MIRSKDLNKEIKILELKIEKTPDKVGYADVVKALVLMLKVARDVKTNQVTDLVKKYGKEILIKPNTPTTRKEGKEEDKKETKKK